MGSGTARRAPLAGVSELATLIGSLELNQAMVLGALRPGLPDEVRVTTKAKLKNGAANVIARTAEDVVYRAGRPAFMLFDTDSKGMPDAIAAKIEQAGGIWQALITVLPELEGIARVERHSTSSGLSRADTGERLPGRQSSYLLRRRGRYRHRALPDGIPRALLACRLGLDDGEQERCPA